MTTTHGSAKWQGGIKDGKVEVKRRGSDEKSEIALDALGGWIAERARPLSQPVS